MKFSGTDAEAAVKKFGATEIRKSLRRFRKQLKLSQKELANLAGLGQEAISRFEQGKRNLSSEALARLQGAIVKAMAQREIAVSTAGVPLKMGLLMKPGPSSQAQDTQDRVKDKLIENLQQLVDALKGMIGIHEERESKKDAKIAELEARIAEYRDLLGLETDAAVSRAKADEKREEIVAQSSEHHTPRAK